MTMDLQAMARQAIAINLVAASCMTCILYDHLITLDQECTRIWPSRWSLPKALFFLNRYVVGGILVLNCIASSRSHLPPAFCIFFLRWLAITVTVSSAVVQGILVMRVRALHRRNKLAIYIAVTSYAGGVITLVGLTVQDFVGESVSINTDLNILPGCYATSIPSIIAGFWITPVIVESILFALVVSRAFWWWKEGSSAPRIMSMLARDSTMYFAVIFVLLLANLFVFEFGPPFLSTLLVTPSTTAGCILGSRLLLNLRGLSEQSNAPEFGVSQNPIVLLPSGRAWASTPAWGNGSRAGAVRWTEPQSTP